MTDTQIPQENPNKLVDTREMSFRFKKDNMGIKRNNVEVKASVPSYEGFVDILTRFNAGEDSAKKEFELLQDAVADVIRAQVGEYVGADEKASQETLPWDKLTFAAIANMPKEDRRSIPAEQWADFTKDYIAIMPDLTNKTVEQVTNATTVFLKKFAPWKSDKETLKKLQAQLAIYMETKNASNFTDVLELLMNRVDMYLKADDLTMVANNL
jgi:hypothetical protein